MDKQDRFARVILNGFYAYFAEFENITLAARTRFEQAEWSSMQDISSRRIDIYKETVMETLAVARHIARPTLHTPPQPRRLGRRRVRIPSPDPRPRASS